MYYSTHYKTKWHDTDGDGVMRPSALLVYMQETANIQCREYGMDLTDLHHIEGKGFLLSRMMVKIFAPIHAYEEIEVRTWCIDNKGYNFIRCFAVYRGEEQMALAVSHWALIDVNEKKMLRTTDFRRDFPYGELPEYANLRDKDGNSLVAAEHEKYQITVNGEAVEKTVRHSNSARFYDGSFRVETEINKISDEYLTVKNWSADTKVTKYTVKVSGISEEYLNSGERNVYPIFDVKYKESYTDPTTKVMEITDGISTYTSSMPDGNKHVHARYIRCKITSSEQTFSFYVFGDGIPEDAVIGLGYYQYNDSNVTPIDGSYEITSESTTLVNYAASTYKADREILFVDWVNAIISELANRYDRLYDLINRMSGLHRWYEYEITIGPGEYLTNAVTAPVYPNIDTAKNPNQYDFVYLLSPASGFASFGDLEIIINSEYVFLESNLGDFEKTEGGYKMSLDGLPKEGEDYLDLMFTMEGDVPDKQPNPNATLGFFERVGSAIANALILVFVVIASAISWFLDLFR